MTKSFHKFIHCVKPFNFVNKLNSHIVKVLLRPNAETYLTNQLFNYSTNIEEIHNNV